MYSSKKSRGHKSLETLEGLHKKIKRAHDYFDSNYKRFNNFMRFVCHTTLDADAVGKLNTMNRPQMEFNSLESIISKQCHEFINQTPSCVARISQSVPDMRRDREMVDTVKFVEAFAKGKIDNFKTNGMAYETIREMMIGGWSVWEIFTDYLSNMAFDQEIIVERSPYATMCFFDPLAKLSHKGDGSYCGKVCVYSKDDAELMFGKNLTTKMNNSQSFSGFNWSYTATREEFVLISEMYEKQKKRKKLLNLSNGDAMLKKDYEDFLQQWQDAGLIEQAPIIIDERMTEVEAICRYVLSDNEVLEEEELDYTDLPLVFFDGNSVHLVDSDGGNSKQMTRPAIYHARSAQQLKNIAGQTTAYEIQNTMAHKLMMPLESIDKNYTEAITNFQVCNTVVYKAYHNDDPDKPIPAPTIIGRPQVPQIITQTFAEADRVIQGCLGVYDNQMVNQKDPSGKAIMQASIEGSGSFSPYVRGYVQGLNRVLQIMVNMIPKYYKTPRSVPVIGPDGKRTYRTINKQSQESQMTGQQADQEPPIYMNYRPGDFNIELEPGVNCEAQKQIALDQLRGFAQMSPQFAEFITEYAMENILDNMDLRGVDELKLNAREFMQMKKQMRQEAIKNKPKDPVESLERIEMAKVQQKSQQTEQDGLIKTAQLALDEQKLEIEAMTAIAELKQEDKKIAVQREKVNAEKARTAIDASLKHRSHMLNVEIARQPKEKKSE